MNSPAMDQKQSDLSAEAKNVSLSIAKILAETEPSFLHDQQAAIESLRKWKAYRISEETEDG